MVVVVVKCALPCRWTPLEVLNVLHFQFTGTRLVVRVDVRHERVPGAIDPFADYAPVLLLAFRVLVGNVALQGRL